jgi:NAD(P)-dependent dehydrogenase (short-subunit alcohol dehydrogenase family)
MKLRDKVAVYCAFKAAVISLTQRADLDLIKHGINVNAIAPRVVDNEHWDNVDSLFARQEKLAPREKSARSASAFLSAAWLVPRRSAGWQPSWPARTPTISWRRLMTAAIA